MKKGMVIAIDFDGTLCENEFPEIGKPKQSMIQTCIQLKQWNNKLILWTCREGELLEAAVRWCKDQGLEFDTVNAPLPEQLEEYQNDTRKIYADIYIDDRAYSPEAYAAVVENAKRKIYIDNNKCSHCRKPRVCSADYCAHAAAAAGEAYRRDNHGRN